MDGPGAYTVHRPQHWIFAGTNPNEAERCQDPFLRRATMEAVGQISQ